nr:type II toxin-antitoxin system HicA family toxin [Syntrophothermus sp.]
MKRAKTYSSRELIRLIQQAGWMMVRISGSHHQFRHPTKPGLVTIPHPRKSLPVKTVKSILKQAGLDES